MVGGESSDRSDLSPLARSLQLSHGFATGGCALGREGPAQLPKYLPALEFLNLDYLLSLCGWILSKIVIMAF